jgi:hypothetical protein
MTLLRKAAVGVSDFVVRHASAGSREWAEGLAREVEFIDGDWKALGWAVSSLPVLLDRRAPVLRSLQDVPALAQKLGAASDSMDGTPVWIVPLVLGLGVAWMGVHMLRATGLMGRAGYGLAMCGWIVSLVAAQVERSRRKERLASPAGDWTLLYTGDVREWALYYKSELEFYIELPKSPFLWIKMFATVCLCVGLAISGDRFVDSAAGVMSVSIGLVPLALYRRRKMQHQLDRLNVLLAGSVDEGI